jgi:hypothetical protein
MTAVLAENRKVAAKTADIVSLKCFMPNSLSFKLVASAEEHAHQYQYNKSEN